MLSVFCILGEEEEEEEGKKNWVEEEEGKKREKKNENINEDEEEGGEWEEVVRKQPCGFTVCLFYGVKKAVKRKKQKFFE